MKGSFNRGPLKNLRQDIFDAAIADPADALAERREVRLSDTLSVHIEQALGYIYI